MPHSLRRSFALALLFALAVLTVPVAAEEASQGVTLANKGNATLYVLAWLGEKPRCEQKKELKRATLAAGETAVIETGGHAICWCFAADAKTKSCMTAMSTAEPGAKRSVR